MSIDNAYVRRALGATMRLAVHDRKALMQLELTADGFFRSFYALILALPAYAFKVLGDLAILSELVAEGEDAKRVTVTVLILVHLVNFLGASLLFLVLMVPLSRVLGVAASYGPMAIAYNWGTLIVWLLYAPVTVLYGLGLLSADDAMSLRLIVMGFALYLRYASLSVTLNAPISVGLALAMIDLLLQFVWFGLLVNLV